MTLGIYMCRDTEQYIVEQQALQAAANATDQAAQTDAADENSEGIMDYLAGYAVTIERSAQDKVCSK